MLPRPSAPPAGPSPARRSRRHERYELQREIGGGGMGTVYQALDHELNRIVAVKVLRPELAPDLRNLLRLKRELVLAARISDEHVVRVHDIGTIGGRALIAMDWIDGESLANLLARVHTLPPSQVYTFAVQIAHALYAIHAAHVVHRDLKPGNLLIRRDGQILVSDFGLARSAAPRDLALTETGESGGTPRYMPPEQLAGLPADTRSDLYSFGMVLLEMLTGTTALETLAPLRLRLLAISGDREQRSGELRKLALLEGVIRGCLKLDRTERYATTDAALHDLQPVEDRSASTTSESKPRVRLFRNRWLAAALLVAVAVLILFGYYARRRNAEAKAVLLYTQALRHITSQSGEAELRAAVESLNQALAYNPGNLSAIRTRLEALIRLWESSGENRWLEKARSALNDANPRLSQLDQIVFASRIDILEGRFGSVVDRFRAHPLLLSSSQEANLLLGRALAGSGQLAPALEYYRAAVRLGPESWRPHNHFGSALLALGRSTEAAREFQRVTELHPDAPAGFSNLGSALLETGDLRGARRNFELALERAPSASAYYNLGVAAYYAREYATAVPFFESAIRMHPKSDIYLGALADVLRHLRRTPPAHESYAQALALLEAVSHSRPLSSKEQCRRAILLARLGDPVTATEALDSLGPDLTLSDLAHARAIVALTQGRYSAANGYLRQAVRNGYSSALIELDPDFDDVH